MCVRTVFTDTDSSPGDLPGRHTGRQIPQHPHLALTQRIYQPGRLRHPGRTSDLGGTLRWSEGENLGDQRGLLGVT